MAWRWAQIALILIGFGVTIGTIVTKFGSMETVIIRLGTKVDVMHDERIRESTANKAEMDKMHGEITRLRDEMDTQTKAYNFNFNARLSVVEAKVGVQPKSRED